MTREEAFANVKAVIKKNIRSYRCGLFFTRNIAGDQMVTIYEDDYFCVDACYYYSYFEVFGLTSDEERVLTDYYEKLVEESYDD